MMISHDGDTNDGSIADDVKDDDANDQREHQMAHVDVDLRDDGNVSEQENAGVPSDHAGQRSAQSQQEPDRLVAEPVAWNLESGLQVVSQHSITISQHQGDYVYQTIRHEGQTADLR